jgi:hypothetical protein
MTLKWKTTSEDLDDESKKLVLEPNITVQIGLRLKSIGKQLRLEQGVRKTEQFEIFFFPPIFPCFKKFCMQNP